MPYCTHCGTEVSETARICPNCNRALPSTSEPPPSEPAPPPTGPPRSQEPQPPGPPPQAPYEQTSQPPQPQQFVPPGSQQPASPKTHAGAVWALVLGILGIVLCPGILSIPAIVVGRISEKTIEESGGWYEGGGMAKAGWIMGIVGTVFAVLILFLVTVPFLLGEGFEGGPPSPPPFFN